MELKKVGNVYNNGGMKKVGNVRDLQNKPPQAPTPQKSGGAWNWTMNQLIKPVASASNALEDTGKGIAAAGIAAVTPYNFRQVANKVGFAPIQHQKDVFSGKNQRTYSTIMNEIASQQNDPVLRDAQKSIGYAGDFMLDPLNKVKVLGLTKTGTDALKTGRMALSAADQAKQGQRALLQLGKYNVLPSVGNKVLEASTAVNDLARSTPYVNKVFDVGSAVSGKIRPLGVGRDEFRVLTEAKNAARNTVGYTTDKAVEFAKGLSKELGKRKADDTSRALLLHAIEKGDAKLAPKGLEDVFQSGLKFKTENEAAWKALGGSTLEGYGLAHVATKDVAEQARKEAFKGQGGFKLTSTNTPQDIHRQWAKADGKIVNLEKEGIKYDNKTNQFIKPQEVPFTEKIPSEKNVLGLVRGQFVKSSERGNFGQVISIDKNTGKVKVKFLNKKEGTQAIVDIPYSALEKASASEAYKKGYSQVSWKPVNVEQATAHEINQALTEQGGKGIFQEDLPIVAAKMGISTGRKQAATEFLEATKGLKSEEAKALANEVHNKMVNPESLRMALKGFDAIQNIWKAQALVAPSYHIRNIAGNLWNNHLADVKPLAYGLAGELQKFDSTGKLSQPSLWLLQKAGYSIDDLPALMDDIKKAGVIGNGQYGGDIAEHISSQIGKTSAINPLSQRFFGYRANRLAGGVLEDNAKIAHFLSKKAEGYGTKQAAESVKKYLFDYGDLTSTEQNLLKRVMPFYTWTSKNIPLQVQQFIENPGKFSDVAIAKKDLEEGVAQPNEQYLSDYVKNNGPIRWKTEPDGTTKYFLAGAWLPAAAALQFLSNPGQNTLGMVTPVAKLPLETAFNKSSFFQNTLGEYDNLKKFPGQKSSYLGMDLDPRTANLLRSIRPLNELDKLNPGEVFGGKNKASFLKGYVDNASNQRGGRYTPEMSQMDRVTNSFLGKLQNYDPKDAKYFYDRDTKQRVSDMDLEIKRAAKNDQKELVTKLIEERKKFIQSRKPQKDNSFYTK